MLIIVDYASRIIDTIEIYTIKLAVVMFNKMNNLIFFDRFF